MKEQAQPKRKKYWVTKNTVKNNCELGWQLILTGMGQDNRFRESGFKFYLTH